MKKGFTLQNTNKLRYTKMKKASVKLYFQTLLLSKKEQELVKLNKLKMYKYILQMIFKNSMINSSFKKYIEIHKYMNQNS